MSKNRRQIDVDYSEGGAIMPTNRLHSNPDWKYAIATGFLVAAMVVPQFSFGGRISRISQISPNKSW